MSIFHVIKTHTIEIETLLTICNLTLCNNPEDHLDFFIAEKLKFF